MKELIGTCVENPFERTEELSRIVENGQNIKNMGVCRNEKKK